MENDKYNEDCRSFTSTFEQVPFSDCISYLREFPTMTGQEIMDYYDSKTDWLLEERVYPPVVLTEDKSKRTPVIYEYVEARSECNVFIKNIKDVEYEIPHMSPQDCIKYINENSTLTGQEMIDKHVEELLREKNEVLENPVWMDK